MCSSVLENILESVCEYFTLAQMHCNSCLYSELVCLIYHPFNTLKAPHSALC